MCEVMFEVRRGEEHILRLARVCVCAGIRMCMCMCACACWRLCDLCFLFYSVNF